MTKKNCKYKILKGKLDILNESIEYALLNNKTSLTQNLLAQQNQLIEKLNALKNQGLAQ